MLEFVKKIGHVIVLCDDLDRMKAMTWNGNSQP